MRTGPAVGLFRSCSYGVTRQGLWPRPQRRKARTEGGIKTCTSGFPGSSAVKNLPPNAGDAGSVPGLGRSSGEGHGNPLQDSCLEEELGGLQPMRLQRVGHDWAIKRQPYTWDFLSLSLCEGLKHLRETLRSRGCCRKTPHQHENISDQGKDCCSESCSPCQRPRPSSCPLPPGPRAAPLPCSAVCLLCSWYPHAGQLSVHRDPSPRVLWDATADQYVRGRMSVIKRTCLLLILVNDLVTIQNEHVEQKKLYLIRWGEGVLLRRVEPSLRWEAASDKGTLKRRNRATSRQHRSQKSSLIGLELKFSF